MRNLTDIFWRSATQKYRQATR